MSDDHRRQDEQDRATGERALMTLLTSTVVTWAGVIGAAALGDPDIFMFEFTLALGVSSLAIVACLFIKRAKPEEIPCAVARQRANKRVAGSRTTQCPARHVVGNDQRRVIGYPPRADST